MTETLTKARRMRMLLNEGRIVISPGAYDGYSVRLIEQMGFEAASTSGASLANSCVGVPDVGVMDLTANVEACRRLARAVSIPLMADADTGYGSAINVAYTVRYFEEAGIAGVNLEDQTWPKRCGYLKGKEVIDAREMTRKIESAVRARNDSDFVIVARTDAIAVEGVDAAIRRLQAYAAAGADMVYPDGVASEEDVARIVDSVPAPVSMSIGFGIRSRPHAPLFSIRRLEQLGVARVCVPRLLPGAAIFAMRRGLELLHESARTGRTLDRPDLIASMGEIMTLMKYDEVQSLDAAIGG
jgi:2-methylisocitrate lyase-like PEP mutase family enzyme